MATQDFKSAYKTIMDDHFPAKMEIAFYDEDGGGRQALFYEKASWVIDGVDKGLRYGENPGQEAALYRLVNGNLVLGDVTTISPGNYLASDVELLKSGKHPGKINITDVDNALNILRYFGETPCTVIVKHNNPCGAALGKSVLDSYTRALMADRVAAFGGAIAINREVDKATAEAICGYYAEVVVAPEFADGVLDIFEKKKNIRVMRIRNMERLAKFIGTVFTDFKSLMDGGIIVQQSFVLKAVKKEDFIPAQATYKEKEYRIERMPSESEYRDLVFGWLIESGVTSNSVLYVKDCATVGIGTGEQDRVGVAEIARDKAYRKLADRICWERRKVPYNNLADADAKAEIDAEVRAKRGGLPGCSMISDAFFPYRDGVDVGIREGITAIIQPGGGDRDFESIEACNEAKVAMVYTGQRSFKH